MVSHPKNRLNLLTQPQIRSGISVMDQAGGQDGWLLTKFFFCVFMGRRSNRDRTSSGKKDMLYAVTVICNKEQIFLAIHSA